MFTIRLLTIVLAVTSTVFRAAAANINENFSSDPQQNGWRIFGDTNLFRWDATNQNLRVTWDSSQGNSYFYHPLGTTLTRQDNFSVAFDLQLTDIGPGPDTNKSTSFQMAIGFINLDVAAGTNFLRGTGASSPDLAELDYFWDSGFGATLWPTFVDANSTFNYNNSSDYAIFALAPGDWYHILMSYTAANQTALLTATNFEKTAGVQITQLVNTNFGDFKVGTISVNSYSDAGQDPQYAGSVLAHGTVDNFVVTVPAPPLENIGSSFIAGHWQVQFNGQTNWLYTLERTGDLQSWSPASATVEGIASSLILIDTNAAAGAAFYRVRANRR
jgi:hypothetical protein